jgi:hypothetical protein
MIAAASSSPGLPAPSIARMHCHATATDPRRLRADRHARCDAFLGYASGPVRFVDIAARAPAQPDGKHWTRCPRCKTWNIFEAADEDAR